MLNPSINHSTLSVRPRLATLFLSLALLIPLAALLLPAQNLSGKFSGTVYDPSGAAVPNATVIMTRVSPVFVQRITDCPPAQPRILSGHHVGGRSSQ